ncbi:MAG: lytic transglycosylase domain-containing protein [Dechloromonas sp.]|jgi:soluble lytic murein transglycosylase-like protein|nr:lytic transglycosylase domain-containing protein [Candidatus Dechloromonas phosphoritropha]MBP8786799.1 lytic transglycosylase domain-containing protein [Azonexus sp.]MBP9227593.1 lytic transglycosylase domain-containing protein [Azonexus sp.]
MFTSTAFPPAVLRASFAFFALLQKFLMVVGLVFLTALVGLQAGHSGLIDGLKTLVSSPEATDAVEDVSEFAAPTEQLAPVLSPKMRGALDYVSKRYRVSTEALEPIFATAQVEGKELRIDPLLIIAVIGVESGFNPFSQSVVGAKGLMQVMPNFHMDKLPGEADASAFLDPVTNVQVGARVLRESISRFGGIETGLQQFGGALNDPDRRYASKVLAEKQRLDKAAQQSKRS